MFKLTLYNSTHSFPNTNQTKQYVLIDLIMIRRLLFTLYMYHSIAAGKTMLITSSVSTLVVKTLLLASNFIELIILCVLTNGYVDCGVRRWMWIIG